MFCNSKSFLILLLLCLFAAGRSFARPDYYTAGFYTRSSDAASYIDQGGVLDPFYLPMNSWSFLPRITLAASGDDNFFMTQDNQQASTSIDLIPGALLIYGRPDHNHLYADVSVGIPVAESGATADDENKYAITVGGVKKTEKSQIHGRLGHRSMDRADIASGTRVVEKDYVGDLGLEHRISTKSSLGVNGSVELHDFGSAENVNYNRYYGSGRFYHRIHEKSEWFLQGGIGRDVMDESQAGVYGDASFYDISVGMRGKPSPKTKISGRVGYQWRAYDDASIDKVASWIANLGAETTPFGLSTFSAELMGSVRPDITGSGDSSVDKRATFGVNRRIFTERLRGDASVLVGLVDRHGPVGTSSEEYWGFSLGLDWWTRWNVSFGAGYSYTERQSTRGVGNPIESGSWNLRMSWNY